MHADPPKVVGCLSVYAAILCAHQAPSLGSIRNKSVSFNSHFEQQHLVWCVRLTQQQNIVALNGYYCLL